MPRSHWIGSTQTDIKFVCESDTSVSWFSLTLIPAYMKFSSDVKLTKEENRSELFSWQTLFFFAKLYDLHCSSPKHSKPQSSSKATSISLIRFPVNFRPCIAWAKLTASKSGLYTRPVPCTTEPVSISRQRSERCMFFGELSQYSFLAKFPVINVSQWNR